MRRLMGVLCCLGMLAGCGGGSSDADVVQDVSGAPADSAVAQELTDDAAESPDVSVAADAPAVDEPSVDEALTDLGRFEAGPPVDACALLSAAEVEVVMGAPGSAESEDLAPLFFGCRWDFPSGYLSVDVISHGDPEAAQTSFNYFLGDLTEVDGIGDAALYNILIDLAFISDGYEVSIDMAGDFDDDTARAHAQDLAMLIIPRLP